MRLLLLVVALLATPSCSEPLAPDPYAEVAGDYVLESIGIHPLPYTAGTGRYGMILLSQTVTLSADRSYGVHRLARMKLSGCDCYGEPETFQWGGTYLITSETIEFIDEWGHRSSATIAGDILLEGAARYRKKTSI